MPFGAQQDAHTGRTIDFDKVYQDLIRPAVEEALLMPLRADEIEAGAIRHKSVLEAAIASDVFLADVTTGNPNVMYELGIRHALRRGMTLLVAANGAQPPFDSSYARIVWYEINPQGELDATAAATTITSLIRESIDRSDSPIYELFPGIHVELPDDLDAYRRSYPASIVKALRPGMSSGPSEMQQVEETLRNEVNLDPKAVVDLLKKYRDESDWDNVIRFSDGLDSSVRDLPDVQQITALALNRRGNPGDQERAIEMMSSLISRTGGDSETFGILGRIYKDRFSQTGSSGDLDRAIACYRSGFEKQPTDYYPAINLIQLLAISNDPRAQDELTRLIPQVRALLQPRVTGPRADFWELSTALQLAVMSSDWSSASDLSARMRGQAPASWVLESTVRQLQELGERAMSGSNREQLNRILRELRPAGTTEAR